MCLRHPRGKADAEWEREEAGEAGESSAANGRGRRAGGEATEALIGGDVNARWQRTDGVIHWGGEEPADRARAGEKSNRRPTGPTRQLCRVQ